MTAKILVIAFALLLASAESRSDVRPRAHPTTGAELVILPLPVGTATGANGSVWSVEGSVRNNSAHSVRLVFGTCLAETKCSVELAPGKTIPLPQPINEPVPYNVVSIQNDDANHPPGATPRDVWFQLRVRDVTRQGESAGTEIPVVRHQRLLDRRAALLDIPVDSRFRANLRLFVHPYTRFTPPGDHRFKLRVVGSDDVPIEERTVSVPGGAQPLIYYGVWAPELLITDLFNRVACGSCRVRVEIEPLGDEVRYWGFVSVTNDATSQVTTISPQ